MMQSAAAKKYSLALFQLAQEKGTLLEIKEELREVVEAIEGYPDLRKIFYHPRVMAKDKKEVITEIFTGKISQLVLNFLQVLIDKRRENFLQAIYKEYVQLVNAEVAIQEVEVTTAINLSASLKAKLEQKLQQLLGNEVLVQEKVDPGIIGGIIIKIGDRIIDGSIKHSLNSLMEQIKQIPVSDLGGVSDET